MRQDLGEEWFILAYSLRGYIPSWQEALGPGLGSQLVIYCIGIQEADGGQEVGLGYFLS